MIFENGKSYRLEILIVYAQNKFVYAHGFKFCSTGKKILIFFFFYQFACSKFYEKFLISRAHDKKKKKRNERYAWKFNQLYPGYTHSYIWYQVCVKLFNFLDFFFLSK